MKHQARQAGAAMCSAGGTIFHKPWWLDAACPGWQAVEVTWDGTVVGRLPFAPSRRHGTTRLEMPPYARVLGPALSLPPSKPVQRLANTRAVVAELVARLPRHDLFLQYLPPGAGQGFAFALCGWTVEESFTFRVPAGSDPSAVWDGMNQKTRNVLRTAQKRVVVEQHADLDRFAALARLQFRQQNRDSQHRHDVLARIFAASERRGRSAILTARSEQGRDAAGAILLWDNEVLYLWTAARDVEAAGNGANGLVIWEALRLALERGLTFDFDGFACPASGAFLASFGGDVAVRPRVSHRGLRSRSLALARDVVDAAIGRRRP